MRTMEAMTREQSDKQVKRLLVDLTVLVARGNRMDCIQVGQALRDRYGIDEDWHEYAYILDMLHTQGKADITQPGGFTEYLVL